MKNNLVNLLSEIEDPRRTQEQRHTLPFVLVIVIMATMSGYYEYRAIGDLANLKNPSTLFVLIHTDRCCAFYQMSFTTYLLR